MCLIGWGFGGVVGEDRIAFFEQNGSGDVVEECRVLKDGIIEGYVGRGRNVNVGGAGNCIGCRTV